MNVRPCVRACVLVSLSSDLEGDLVTLQSLAERKDSEGVKLADALLRNMVCYCLFVRYCFVFQSIHYRYAEMNMSHVSIGGRLS